MRVRVHAQFLYLGVVWGWYLHFFVVRRKNILFLLQFEKLHDTPKVGELGAGSQKFAGHGLIQSVSLRDHIFWIGIIIKHGCACAAVRGRASMCVCGGGLCALEAGSRICI